MKLKLETYKHLCSTKTFEINDILAESSDFGTQRDINPECAHDYCCGNMQFVPKQYNIEILKKYNITMFEYHEVCDLLKNKLSFGCCCWCA